MDPDCIVIREHISEDDCLHLRHLDDIDLLRKTSLSIFPETMLSEMFSVFNDENLQKFNLPELKTKIDGPVIMVIPIAIYA